MKWFEREDQTFHIINMKRKFLSQAIKIQENKCHLCGEAMLPVSSFPDLMRATADHVIPLSLGGRTTAENIKAAHYSCNTARGNKIIPPT
jgi:5-methylcytosine-specific restriction endonuclease McrA